MTETGGSYEPHFGGRLTRDDLRRLDELLDAYLEEHDEPPVTVEELRAAIRAERDLSST